MKNFALKFQAVAEKSAKDASGLLYFAAPGKSMDTFCGNHVQYTWLKVITTDTDDYSEFFAVKCNYLCHQSNDNENTSIQ